MRPCFAPLFVRLLPILLVLKLSAQSGPQFIFKTDPVFNFNGRWNMGIEKPIKGDYTMQTNVSIVSAFGDGGASFGNPGSFLMVNPDDQFRSLNGFSAQIQLRKYVNESDWMNGAFIGLGLGHNQETLKYTDGNKVTSIQTEKQLRHTSGQIFYISGYQGDIKNKVKFSVSGGLGLRNIRTPLPYMYETASRSQRIFHGIFQFSLMAPLTLKSSVAADSLVPGKIKTTKVGIFISPFTFVLTGKGLSAGFTFRLNNNKMIMIEGWNVPSIERSSFFSFSEEEIIQLRGVKIGIRDFVKAPMRGYYAGFFAEYNHLEVKKSNFIFPARSIKIAVKDQFAGGVQYGYVLRHASGAFLDINGNSGLRIGNQPHVNANSIRNLRMNFNNGVFNKIFIKIGYAF